MDDMNIAMSAYEVGIAIKEGAVAIHYGLVVSEAHVAEQCLNVFPESLRALHDIGMFDIYPGGSLTLLLSRKGEYPGKN